MRPINSNTVKTRVVRRMVLQSALGVAVLGLLLLAAPSAGAATKTFTVPGNFSTALNWGGSLPVAGDDLVINVNCTFDAGANNLVYGTLTIGTVVGATLSWPNGGTNTLNVSNVSSGVAGSALNMTNGGKLIIRGTWTSTNLTFTPGPALGTGTIEIQSSMTLPAAYTVYNNLIINGAATTVTLGATFTANTSLVITSGTLNLSTFTANRTTSGAGPITISAGATLKIGGTNTFPTNYTTKTIDVLSTVDYSGTAQTVGAQNYGHLTLSNSGAKTFAATTIGIAGTFTISGTATANMTTNSPTVDYDGTGSQTVLAQTYYNLTISDAGTKTLAGNVIVNNNLGVSNTATLDLSTFSANRASAGGALTLSSTATLKIGGTNTLPSNYSTHAIAATTTVEYSGTTQSVAVLNSAQDYGHLTISSSGVKTLAGTAIVAGNLTVSAGTFDTGSHTINRLTAGGTLTVSNGATLDLGGTNTFPSNYNTHSIGATSTVEYGGTTQSVIVLNSSQNYGNLTILGSGTKTLAGIANVAGDLTISAGTFDLAAHTINRTTAGGTLTLSSGAALKIGGTHTLPSNYSAHSIAATSTVEYNGTAQSVVALNSSQDYGHLIISGTAVKTLTGSENVAGDLTISSGTFDLGANTIDRTTAGGTLTLSSGAALKIGGTNTLPSSYSAHSIAATSTVEYSGTTQSVVALNSAQDYGQLIISGSGTKTLSATENVAGDLTISAGTFDLGANTIDRTTAGGTLTLSSGAALKIGGTQALPSNYSAHSIAATSTVEYGGTTQSVVALNSAQDYGNLIISGSGTKTLAATENVAADLSISAGTFDLGANTINRTTAGGTLTLSSGTALKIGGTSTFPSNYDTHSIGATSTVEYSGTTQSVVALNSAQDYGHLIISGSATKTLAGAENTVGNLTISAGIFSANNFDIAVAGNWTNNAATTGFTAGTGTVTFNGTGAQAVAGSFATTFNNLTISNTGSTVTSSVNSSVSGNLSVLSGTFDLGAFTANRASSGGTLSVSNGATLKIGGTNTLPSNFSAHSIGATSTVQYSGTTQSVAVLNTADYGHLTISGSGTKTLAGTQNVAGNLTVSAGTFDLGANTINRTTAGGTLSLAGAATLKIGGTNTLPANYTTHSMIGVSVIEYSGTNQSVAVLNGGVDYLNLTISGSGTKTLAGNVSVFGTLTLTSGTITTGANTLYAKATGIVNRVSGYVIGNFKRGVSTGPPLSRTWFVGDASNYTPVVVAFASVSTAGDLTVSTNAGDHANIGTSTINAAKSVNRTWTLTSSGIVFTTYDATFTFVAGDIDGGANTAAFVVGKYSAGWTYPTVGTRTGTTTQATGLTSFSDFQIGEAGAAPGAISGTVFEDTNYGGGVGRSLASSSGAAAPSARVELYTAAGNYSTFATTDGSGNYSFANLPDATYTVRVVNGTVNSSRSGTEVLPPVQTYRTNASSGAAVAVTDHVGGEVPASVDAGNGSTTLAALTAGAVTPQSITSAVVSASNITGVDFGYSYNVIVNKNDAGQGSLRQFLLNANALSNTGLVQSGLTSGKDNAVFMLADGTARAGLTASYATQFASGIASITLANVLPTITDPLILDGSLQPGYAGVPMIELNGAAVANAGLTITAGNSTVRGFIINRFNGATGNGISLSAAGSNTITGNYIGTNAAGTTAAANSHAGISISSANNTVGGTTVAARNVISGNTSYGVGIDGVGSTGNLIEGNYIGTNAAGTAALANTSHGVYVFNGAASNTIGGTAAGAGNLISGNAGKGVVIAAGTGNAILSNSTHGNTGIGIDLTDDGVTANNGTKSGALANSGMDTPVFTTKTLAGTSLTISGYVGSAAGQSTFASASVQVFKSDNDASGFGEGQTLLGTLTTDASGNFSGTITVSLAVGDKITATATDGSNNTSEFGANATVAAPPPNVALVNSVLPSGTQPPGTDLVYTVVFTNGGGQAAQVFIVIDPIPAHTDFKLGSQSTNLGTTGLTVAISYSNDNAATWTYTPVSGAGGASAGYDRAVTHVRWSFTGNLSQGSPNNTGSISLTAKIR